MKTFKTIFKGLIGIIYIVLGIAFVCVGIAYLFAGLVGYLFTLLVLLIGFIFIIIGLFILPPSLRLIEQKLNYNFPTPIKRTVVILAGLVLVLMHFASLDML